MKDKKTYLYRLVLCYAMFIKSKDYLWKVFHPMSCKEKAIIIGGGISGKLAARVLSEFFKEVVILERDQEPEGPFPRKGAPQSEHLHALLFAGEHGLKTLFPGITEESYLSGAVK